MPAAPDFSPSTDRPQIVVVAGMHRSGTSLAAEILVRLGAWTRSRLLEGNEYNPRGYWEDADLVDLNDRILTALDRPWGGTRAALPMPRDWLSDPALAPLKAELEAFLRAGLEAAGGTPWMVKDPRICRLMPLWRQVADDAGLRLAAVLTVRSPDAVAASLARRDRFPDAFGRLLWLVNSIDLLAGSGDLVEACITYDQWFSDAPAQVLVLARVAGLDGPHLDPGAVAAEIVSDTLRHHEAGAGNALADRLYRELETWAKQGSRPPALDGMVDLVAATLAEAAPALADLNDPAFIRESLEAKLAEYQQAYQRAATRYDEMKVQTDDLKSLLWRFERPLRFIRSVRRSLR